jgi:hypothetical protein
LRGAERAAGFAAGGAAGSVLAAAGADFNRTLRTKSAI